MQSFIHYFLHFGAPLAISYYCFRSQWKKVYILFLITMLVDLDHLLASPIFDPNRCSINFHPLHSYYAISIYFLLLLPKQTRIIALALLFHMVTDYIDCYMTLHHW